MENSIFFWRFQKIIWGFFYGLNLKKLQQKAGLGKADLHIHLAKATPQQILDYVQNHTDLDVIALTDHDSIESTLKVKEVFAQSKEYRFELIVGEEVTSRDGHIVGLFLKKSVPSGLSAHETMALIKEQGGLVIAVHPFQYMRWRDPRVVSMDGVGLKILLKEKKNIDGIEVVNASPGMSDENLEASLINQTILLKAETGSSDAHIPEVIGKAYTVFKGYTAEELRYAILRQQTRAIRGKWSFKTLLKYGCFSCPMSYVLVIILCVTAGKKRNKLL